MEKVIALTLSVTVEEKAQVIMDTWDDPGDYPSRPGAGPLPSREFAVLQHGGTFIIDLEKLGEEIIAGGGLTHDSNLGIELFLGLKAEQYKGQLALKFKEGEG